VIPFVAKEPERFSVTSTRFDSALGYWAIGKLSLPSRRTTRPFARLRDADCVPHRLRAGGSGLSLWLKPRRHLHARSLLLSHSRRAGRMIGYPC
jgi:hypothetical protein